MNSATNSPLLTSSYQTHGSFHGRESERFFRSLRIVFIDPLMNLFQGIVPSFCTAFDAGRLLDSTEDAQTLELLSPLTQGRRVSLYGTSRYHPQSYGGPCSLSAPVVVIPTSYQKNLTSTDKKTKDAYLFATAREIAYTQQKPGLLSLISKVLIVAAALSMYGYCIHPTLFGHIVQQLHLTVIPLKGVSLALLTLSSVVNLMEKRFSQYSLNQKAIDMLHKDAEIPREDAYQAADTFFTLELEENKKRREGSSITRFCISETGEERLDISQPSLESQRKRLQTLANRERASAEREREAEEFLNIDDPSDPDIDQSSESTSRLSEREAEEFLNIDDHSDLDEVFELDYDSESNS